MTRVTAFFRHLVDLIQPIAEQFGGFGLTLVAFFDSSFLSLPEASDILVVLFTTRTPDLWWYYGLMTTAGSVAGSYTLYALGKKGGEAFLRRRVRARHVEWGMALFQRHGMLAIVVPSLLPPPMPFKMFVLLAGLVGVRPWSFVGAVVVGRGFRYLATAWLARTYGERAFDYIRENLPGVSLAVAVALIGFAVIIALWQRRVAS